MRAGQPCGSGHVPEPRRPGNRVDATPAQLVPGHGGVSVGTVDGKSNPAITRDCATGSGRRPPSLASLVGVHDLLDDVTRVFVVVAFVAVARVGSLVAGGPV